MRVNVKEVLNDYTGNPILNPRLEKDGKTVTHIPLTVLDALVTAINNPAQLRDEQGHPRFDAMGQPISEFFTAEQKGRSYQLSTKLYSSDDVDFTESEVEYIKERIDKICNTQAVSGRLLDLLTSKN